LQEKNGKTVGKLPASQLEKLIETARRAPHPSTLIGPKIGEDAAVIDTGGCLLVSHVDPITEASAYAGTLAIQVAANDLAVTGAIPRWAQILLLLPPGSNPDLAREILEAAADAAAKLGIDIIGGHTEYTPGLVKPVIAAFVMGCACPECLTPTSGAKPGQVIVQAGWAGAEGTAILASDFEDLLSSRGVPKAVIEEAKRLAENISIVDIAIELARRGLASAMHDATEGGILGALVEMALASGNTLEVDAGKILVHETTRIISERLGIDPLRLISSGAFIIAADPDTADKVVEFIVEKGLPASQIGTITAGTPQVRVKRGERTEIYKEPPIDEISRFWV